jgi:hypothetical protein
MDPKRRQLVLLGVLVVVLAGAIYMRWPRAVPASSSAAGAAAQRVARSATSGTEAPDVHLDALREERPKPGSSTRNLFRFRPLAPPPGMQPRRAAPSAPAPPPGPPPPPPIPPIPLRFIGLLEPGGGQKIAILSDGRGAPVYGKEGETVLGQYKILRIGTESIEMSYLDGRGRQTVRLSGT